MAGILNSFLTKDFLRVHVVLTFDPRGWVSRWGTSLFWELLLSFGSRCPIFIPAPIEPRVLARGLALFFCSIFHVHAVLTLDRWGWIFVMGWPRYLESLGSRWFPREGRRSEFF